MKASPTTLRKPQERWPKKTFQGRDRISLVPRWISNWIITGAITWGMLSYGLRFMGFDNFGWDPFAQQNQSIEMTPTPVFVPEFPVQPAPQFSASTDGNAQVPAVGVTPVYGDTNLFHNVQATYTPLPTYTPYPTQRPMTGQVLAVGYSYYYPPFGPPNCALENWKDDAYCLDTTASGLPWSDYIGLGVAVPWEWRESVPLLSTLTVYSPYEMVGDYLVVDYCGDCIKKEGHIYVDFLDNRMRLAWTVPMLVSISPPLK
jgi:hypothetical protein